MNSCIRQFFRLKAFRYQMKVVNALTDIYPHLVRKDHTREWN
jgi:hypothetical protein